jgi:NAD(P)-dependent dehydrogenase (short-subunit alcohol dehydrogenase family)
MKNVVITGSSTGIGWATSAILIKNGFHVFGSVRKQEDAHRLSAEFGENYTPLIFDVTDEGAVQKAAEQVRERLNGRKLDGLVNNAGIAVPGPLQHLPIQQFRRQLEVNLVGPLIVTQAFLPLLGADRTLQGRSGRVVNISSVAGKTGTPFLGAYVTSKHGLEGFSESLRREVLLYGIDVIVIGPGPIATPIWDKSESTRYGDFESTDYWPALEKFRKLMVKYGRSGYPPERVGEVVLKALISPHPSTRYSVIPRRILSWTIPQMLPKRSLDKIMAKGLGYKHILSAKNSKVKSRSSD